MYPRLYTSIFIAWGIFYKGGVFMNRNHEGYHDPTACEAIRRASKNETKRRGKKVKSFQLTYMLSEVKSFADVVSKIMQ